MKVKKNCIKQKYTGSVSDLLLLIYIELKNIRHKKGFWVSMLKTAQDNPKATMVIAFSIPAGIGLGISIAMGFTAVSEIIKLLKSGV